jgi:hypothetical protein
MTSVKESKDILKNMQNIYKSNKTSNILGFIENMTDDDEFEVSIDRSKQITVSQYMDLIKYVIEKANNENKLDKLEKNISLDIVYKYTIDNANVYRITIEGEDRINRLMSNLEFRKNHSLFSILTNNILNQTSDDEKKYLYAIEKVKNKLKMIDIEDHDLRFRLSQELPIKKEVMNQLINISETEKNNISFRFKERLSYNLYENNDYAIRIDITNVRQNMSIHKLEESKVVYEIELEIIKKNKKMTGVIAENAYNQLLFEIYKIHQLSQKSTKIITVNTKNSVLNKFNILLYGNFDSNKKDLPAMQSQSLENQHVASDLTTQYAVDDKADGERFFMMISNNSLYLISNNLDIKEIDSSQYNIKEYDGTILDGEYVYISEKNKYLFLAFDCLIYRETDIREEPILEKRLNKMNDVLVNCFGVNTHTVKYDKTGNLKDIVSFYEDHVKKYFEEMNKKLVKEPNVVMGKLFFMPLGLYGAELYAYAEMVWNYYTNNTNINCPYVLDGLIFTPLNQKYTRNLREIKHQIYKWKPSKMNSIDFYIKFEKNPDTLQLLNVYDNSFGKDLNDQLEKINVKKAEQQRDTMEEMIDYKIGNKIYRICNLYVGSTKKGTEEPVLFGKENNLFLAYMYLQDGEVRDVEGNIIQDNTVVEFSYNNDPTKEHPYRWVPLRTRFDKTESVIKFQRKYGNNEMIADKVWRSILSPFDFNDIKMLANDEAHDNYMKNVIRPRVTKEDIVKERTENIFYQIQSDLAEPMRNFHNFIKSNLIYTVCYKKELMNGKTKNLSILDMGIGVGGDLMKYYHARVSKIVGFDPKYDHIYSATDSASSRYQTHKRKFPNFPKSTFFIGDARYKLNSDSQEKAIGVISDINVQTIKDIFGGFDNDKRHDKFDIISCQFMFHYLFENDQSFDNFCDNVNKYLNNSGYIIITTNDGKLIHDAFVDNKITHYYTDTGKKKLLFEYKKMYSDNNTKQTGLAIDYTTAISMTEGTYITEYLVDPNYLEDELKKRCNVKLVETDTFENQFNIMKYFFDNVAPYEANEKTRSYFMKIKKFYDMNDDMNKNSFEMTKLIRYYVFQKL